MRTGFRFGDGKQRGSSATRPYFVPLFIIALLAAGFGISLLFQDQSPVIDGLNPHVGNPGDVMVIDGNFFGDDRTRAWVTIGGQRITAGAILDWTPQKISLRIPDDAKSGAVYVQTTAGRSRGQSFTNQNQMPHIIQPSDSTIEAFISGTSPAVISNGDPVIVSGGNFGRVPGDLELTVDGDPLSPSDIFEWSQNEIGFWAPTRSGASELVLRRGDGVSNQVLLHYQDGTARIRIGDTGRLYRLELQYNIGDVELAHSPAWGTISAYMPLVPASVEQAVDHEDLEGARAVRVDANMLAFQISEPKPDTDYHLSATWQVNRKAVFLDVDTDPDTGYDKFADLQALWAVPSAYVPSGEASVKAFAKSAVGAETKPLTRARLLYQALLNRVSYDANGGLSFGPEVLGDRRANAFGMSDLYVCLLRATGIPARMVEGVFVPESGDPVSHYWVELFIPTVGWVSADPAMGAGALSLPDGASRGLWYFGNLDDSHIALIRGESLSSVTRLDANIQKLFQHFVLMQVHAEGDGNVSSYGLFIENPQALRIN